MRGVAGVALAAAVGLSGLIVTTGTARAESVPSLVEQGNKLYQAGQLAAALEKYRQAQKGQPGSPALHYNIGNVLYKQGEFEKAYDEYRQAFAAGERPLAEGARFNAGNSHYARKNWPEAIRNYQEALRLDPRDIDAKKNLELALQQLQEEKKKQQQPPPQKQDQDQDQKDKNQPQPKDQKGSPQNSPRPEPREQNKPGGEKERISQEEAKRILDAMKDQDRPPSDQIKAPPPDKRPEKDW